MRINRLVLGLGVMGLALSGSASAFDPDTTPGEAFRTGYAAYVQGHTEEAVEALNFAAEKGHPAALWKLARMYATGDGVQEDDARAFLIYSRIANEHADGNPRGRDAPFVADAFVALGTYLRAGIPGAVTRDEGRARRFYAYAASYFGEAQAQYELASMYRDGAGGEQNARQAVRWFNLAAGKGHVHAQAELGRLLFDGVGVRRSAVMGLKWLTVALRVAEDDPDIRARYEDAYSQASESDRQRAAARAEAWLERRRER